MQHGIWVCSDCRSLQDGMHPHQYLVAIGSDGTAYECLLCRSRFAYERAGPVATWTRSVSGTPPEPGSQSRAS
jgi:hypothetical protein